MKKDTSSQQSLRVTHISDVHYGLRTPAGVAPPTSAHYFVTKNGSNETPDPRRLASFISQAESGAGEPDMLVISGDLGWSASDPDYAHVSTFLDLLRQARRKSRFVIVPGNHDVNVNPGVDDEGRQSGIERLLQSFYGDKYHSTYPFFMWDGAKDLSHREKIVSIQEVHGRALVVGVNSAAYITGLRDTENKVFISRQVLEAISRYLVEHASAYASCSLKLFVMHHHLLPFVEAPWGNHVDMDAPPNAPDPTTVANSGQLQTWLARNEFDVVLHGHKHMPHGRTDSLWTTHEPQRFRHIAVIGAGTAGVASDELPPGERLCLNDIQFSKIGSNRWNACVAVRGMYPDRPGQPIKDLFDYRLELGPQRLELTSAFASETMDLCHQAIADERKLRNPLRNFVSVVTHPVFILPSQTARIGEAEITLEHVQGCFRVLHPEYDDNYGWGIQAEVDGKLRDVPRRFAFQHGPRIFGIPGNSALRSIQPIRLALQALDSSDTRGYVSLLSTESDVLSERNRQPTPALVGLQFVKNGKCLDLVAHFRSLELSFWWVVNMYEACLLLDWARKEKNMTAGSITFFAPVAEWLDDPRPSFPTQIDELSIGELADLAVSRSRTEVERLFHLIDEKIKHTSIFDLDAKGLRVLVDLFGMGATRDTSCLLAESAQTLAETLKLAASEIEQAMMRPPERQARVHRATTHLKAALRILQTVLGD